MLSVSALASAGQERQSEGHYMFSRSFQELDPVFTGVTAAKRAVRKLGSKPLKTGVYNVSFDNEIMADIIGAFQSVFSARSAQTGRSLLMDKAGTKIASGKLTITDDPLLPGGLVSHPFDDEGHPVKKINIVKNGVFKTFLHNIYSADIWNVKSTGHAARHAGYKNTLGIAPSNMFIQPGKLRFSQLMQKRNKIIHITSIQGINAGLNPVTGDFSLSATGFLYEKGILKNPVHNFTVAGNFMELLQNIVEIGADFKFGSPSGVSSFGSPTVLFKNIHLSGEK
jgi:PmbA protein